MSHELPVSGKDYRDVLCLDDILRSNTSLQIQQADILQVLVKSLRSESGNFCLHDLNDPAPKKDGTALFNLSWNYTCRYIKYYHRLDPFLQALPDANANREVDVLSHLSWQSLEFNTDFIKPQGIRHLLVIYLHDGSHLCGHIGIHRWETGFAFSDQDLFKARFLSRLINLYLRQKQSQQESSDLEQVLKFVMDRSPGSLVILNSSLQPIYWNSKTLEFGFSPLPWKERKACLGDGRPVLPPEIINQCLSLSQTFLHEKQRLTCEKWRVALQINQNQLVEIEVIPVGNQTGENRPRLYFLISFSETRKAKSKKSFALPYDWKLTPKEMEIVEYISKGLTNKEIADKLFISVPTVATHVHHVFQKVDVNSRCKLTHELRLRMNSLS